MNLLINQNQFTSTNTNKKQGFVKLAERITALANFSQDEHALSTEISRAVQVQMNFIVEKEKKNKRVKKALRSFIEAIKHGSF